MSEYFDDLILVFAVGEVCFLLFDPFGLGYCWGAWRACERAFFVMFGSLRGGGRGGLEFERCEVGGRCVGGGCGLSWWVGEGCVMPTRFVYLKLFWVHNNSCCFW